MTNYAVTVWNSSVAPLSTVLTELETKVETVAAAKTIRSIGVVPVGDNTQAFIVHDT
jgi:hypothetical protein